MKGGLFGVDILTTNGAFQWAELAPPNIPLGKFERKYTKVNFCQKFARSIIQKSQSKPLRMRRRLSAGMRAHEAGVDEASIASPAHAHRQATAVHKLQDTRFAAWKAGGAKARQNCSGGMCAYEGCEYATLGCPGEKKTAYRCSACVNAKGAQGAYFHVDCYNRLACHQL